METSAKTGESVEEAFLKCSKTILAKIETGELDPERIGSGKLNQNIWYLKLIGSNIVSVHYILSIFVFLNVHYTVYLILEFLMIFY